MRTLVAALTLVSVTSCADAQSEDTRSGASASESRASTPSTSPPPSSSAPEPSQTSETSGSSKPAGYAESEQCRRDAHEVLDVLRVALRDADVADVAERLDTIEGMMPMAVSQCTAAVARPTAGAVASSRRAVDAARTGDPVEEHLGEAARLLQVGQQAVDAFA